jgi:hypothetical protein
MGDLSKYARPHREPDSKQITPQKRPRRRSGVPQWAVIALGLLVGGVISQALRGSWSIPEVERLIADELSMLGW